MIKFPRRRIKLSLAVFSLIQALWLPIILVQQASAVSVLSDSDVYSILCDGVLGPDIQVTSPQSDSVVDKASVKLSGTTTRTTQIEVYVNDEYSESISVNPDGPFNTHVGLQKGTNTIRLEAYFSCNHTSAEFSVVVTYEPKVRPSPGTDTDTNVPGGIQIPPTISNPNPITLPEEQPDNPSIIERIGQKLTFQGAPAESDSSESTSSISGTIIAWIILALLLLFFAALIVPGFFIRLGGLLTGSPGDRLRRHAHRMHHTVRFISLIMCVGLTYLLLI